MAEKPSGIFPVAISRVSFGVRYEPQYKVIDHLGGMVDAILRTDGTPFGPDVFTHTAAAEVNERVLIGKGNKKNLRLNQQDVILTWEFDTRKLDDLAAVAKSFDEFVLHPLRTKV